jgi:hypothetical protein
VKFKFGRLGRRYGKHRRGHAQGKRSEGAHVDREPGRLYYVAGNGDVMSAPMKKR